MDKISIVMPSYNSELYIEEAINSVINQSYTNWELLIVDDGSTDSTGKIIDLYALKDNRIKVFHTINYGVSHARNIGLDNSTGEWLNFLDSDDILPNNALENLINNSKDSNFIVGNCEYIPENHNHYRITKNEYYETLKSMEDGFCALFSNNMLTTIWGKLIKKDIIDFYFEENYQNGEDTIFFSILLTKVKGIKLITNNVYFYRINNQNSITHNPNIYSLEANIIAYKSFVDYFNNDTITLFVQQLFLNKTVREIIQLFSFSNKSEDEIKNIILSIINNKFFKSISFGGLLYQAKYQRLASVLLIGDMDLIMNEFKKSKKIRDK